MSFVHLHLHTEYSLLDGACRIRDIFGRAKELGQNAVAVTDHGVMYGVIDFYKAAKAEGIKPIIGCEVYVSPRKRTDRDPQLDRENRHLVLLCENETGYRNLMLLDSLAWTEGFYSKPRIDLELLERYHEGLIGLSACLAGEIPRALMRNDYEAAKKAALEYKRIFGENSFFLELQDHGLTEQRKINPLIIRLSAECGIPLAATNDCHYVRREDSKTQDILLCIQTNKRLNEENPMRFPNDEFYMKSESEMRALFPAHPEAIENTQRIADRCSLEIEFGKRKLPCFSIPGEKDHTKYFRDECYKGLHRRYGYTPDRSLIDRLEYEIDVIDKMGFVDYFLIVNDYVGYARKKGIPVGPGRGSGAGSLAAYCIGITNVDPIKFDLLFERFLNPERVSMPDFDIDFCTDRRQEVIEYVREKYGADRVAQIASFGTMAAKGSVRDVGKVLDIPAAVYERVARLIPTDPDITFEKALARVNELKKLYDTDDTVHGLIDTAGAVEGMPKNVTIHAAGVVITENPVREYVPIAKCGDVVVTQYTMSTLEKLGLLKMDFLGLRNLTIIHDAELAVRSEKPDFDINRIPDNDPEVFALFAAGDTDGVFQFESDGMKKTLIRLGPKSLEDIVAVLALYRPGPMDSIGRYIENCHDPSKITYRHPLLEPILRVTYGCIIYQEQVMQIFRSLAGYSLGRADIVRRAMSKKNKSEMEKERQVFIYGLTDDDGNVVVDGCIRRGVPEDTAKAIFTEMESFASYAFNKSHAVSYSLVSYQTAYLKCHHPAPFYAALLTNALNSGSDKKAAKIALYTDDCAKRGISVLPPHVNTSEAGFAIKGNMIIFGLRAIRNVGKGLIDKIVRERKNGLFKSYYDFCKRVFCPELNKRSLEALISCGALDDLGANRKQMHLGAELFLSTIAEERSACIDGQLNLFGIVPGEADEPKLPRVEEYTRPELLEQERLAAGLYFSGHPMSEYDDAISAAHADRICDITDKDDPNYYDGKSVDVFAMITKVKLRTTKSGEEMADVQIEDKYGSVELTVFARTLTDCRSIIRENNIVRISGRIDTSFNGDRKINCSFIQIAPKTASPSEKQSAYRSNDTDRTPTAGQSAKKKKTPPGLYLRFPTESCREYRKAVQYLDIFEGTFPVVLYFADTKKRLSTHADINDPLVRALSELLSDENVVLVKNLNP